MRKSIFLREFQNKMSNMTWENRSHDRFVCGMRNALVYATDYRGYLIEKKIYDSQSGRSRSCWHPTIPNRPRDTDHELVDAIHACAGPEEIDSLITKTEKLLVYLEGRENLALKYRADPEKMIAKMRMFR